MATAQILDTYGKLGVDLLKQKVSTISATHKTEQSIHYTSSTDRLQIFAREFFDTIETGRGPRKSSEQGNFKSNMLEYMQARGIGNDLTQKKKEQLARFFTWKINKEGDKTFKAGGRQVYSDALNKLVDELKKALIEDFKKTFINSVKISFNAGISN